MSEFAHSRRARKAIARIEKTNRLTEPIEAALYAQRWRQGLQFLLIFGAIGDTIFLLVARPYWVAVTTSRFVIFRAGRVFPKVGQSILDAPLESIRLERLGGGPLRRRFRVRELGGAEHQISVHRAYWKEVDRVNELVGSEAG